MAHSSPRPASPNSSSNSIWNKELTLDQLVTHFVASKRSLSSTSHVWRANEIVTGARDCLEENAALKAKNAFLRGALDEQLLALEAVNEGVQMVGGEAEEEFQRILRELDAASDRLKETLNALKSTLVEPSLRPSSEERKYLYDFVLEDDVNETNAALRGSIDNFNAAHTDLFENATEFVESVDLIRQNVVESPLEQDMSPVPELCLGLESHATEMAELLSSLVRHYDLCVTALKHTEGGGEAIEQATGEPPSQQQIPSGLGVINIGEEMEAPQQPITTEERADMIAILDKDAAEVEDVVTEIRYRLNEMEEQAIQVNAYMDALRASHAGLVDSLRLVKKVAAGSTDFIQGAVDFTIKWDEEKRSISEKMDRLEELRHFYEDFLHAYDALLEEVWRRRENHERREAIARKAMQEIELLYQADLEERMLFRETEGQHIPSDIWPGLTSASVRHEIRAVGMNGEEAVEEVPAIPKEVMERIQKKKKARG